MKLYGGLDHHAAVCGPMISPRIRTLSLHKGRVVRSWIVTVVALLLCHIPASVHAAVPLPPEFTVAPGASGLELIWSPTQANATTSGSAAGIQGGTPNSQPTAAVVRIGGSRPEFRLENGTIVGYPRETKDESTGLFLLALPLTPNVQDLLDQSGGQDLQVWSSGRRLDIGGLVSSNSTSSAGGSAGIAPPGIATAVASTPTISVDPAARGNYTTKRLSYDLFPRVNYSEFSVPMEVVAEVTYPNKTALPLSPLVLFLHGRHATCYFGGPNGSESLEWPCPPKWLPIPSHRGYRYVADLLASQGYVVVSISANSVNAQDDNANDYGASARSILIRHHLKLWSTWNTVGGDPWNGLFRGTLDMSKVVLVGHSRGGEGVNRAAVDAAVTDPFKIVGLVSYGPTSFGRQVTPDLHSATLLPTCDGDVSDLQGQAYIDSSRDIAFSPALRSAVIVLGANHNYFNTEWTPGLAKAPAFDDWWDQSDPVCGSDGGTYRLTPQEQQVVGAAYTAALVRLAVKQEVAMLPLLDGSYVRPDVIGRAEVATHAVGGAGSRLVYRPESAGVPVFASGMKGGECVGYVTGADSSGLPSCYEGESPHWLSRIFEGTHPSPVALNLRWRVSGATVRFSVPSGKKNFAPLDYIDARVANDPARNAGAKLELQVRDTQGRSVTLNTSLSSIDGWPGSGQLDRVHARALRGSLASARSSSVDLKNIAEIVLVAKSASGNVWVLDVSASQGRVVVPPVLDLPVLSVESATVPEGDGLQTFQAKILSDRPLTTSGAVWVQVSGSGYKLNLVPSSSNVVGTIPISWVGDTIYSQFPSYPTSLVIGAISGAVTGNFIGGVEVLEDDPPPTLTVKKATVSAREGTSLAWTFNLSAPTAGTTLYCYCTPPPTGQTELTTADVPTSWLKSVIWTDLPSVPTPLSSLSISPTVSFGYGATSATLYVPIASDGKREGDEWVTFVCSTYDFPMADLTIQGKVPSN